MALPRSSGLSPHSTACSPAGRSASKQLKSVRRRPWPSSFRSYQRCRLHYRANCKLTLSSPKGSIASRSYGPLGNGPLTPLSHPIICARELPTRCKDAGPWVHADFLDAHSGAKQRQTGLSQRCAQRPCSRSTPGLRVLHTVLKVSPVAPLRLAREFPGNRSLFTRS